ncbi:MAG TPA: hypothetical protein VH328_14145 [Burkholderiaceae bacterium]|nr:hypothetical protein [Burkholderiaceae bacterium]
MHSAFGSYAMTREGSGTSWQPDASPMEGKMAMPDDWMLMAHGYVNAIYDDQSGPRGAEEGFTQSMAMLMAQHPAGPGTLGLRAMLSLDPTMGPRGYPLLFQTGETANGVTPLVDRQHPHDAFMELSASYSMPLGQGVAAFVYGGLPGEPALGPPAFMHRYSAMRNPEAPLTHHWLDSTHITFGVVTLGASDGPWKLEASAFNGREPDAHRWNIETRAFDSWSSRLTWNPAPAWSMQVSYGDLKSPEQLEPDVRVRRTTASALYQADTPVGPWGTTLAWGQNHRSGPGVSERLPGWLLESTLVADGKHTFFGRFEQVLNEELFQSPDALAGDAFRIRKLSLGYIYDFAKTGAVSWGLGGLVGRAFAPAAVDAVYGAHPTSMMVFLQGRV